MKFSVFVCNTTACSVYRSVCSRFICALASARPRACCMFSPYSHRLTATDWMSCCLTDGYSSHFAVNKCVQIDGRKLSPNCWCTKYNVSFSIYIKQVCWVDVAATAVAIASNAHESFQYQCCAIYFARLILYFFSPFDLVTVVVSHVRLA